MKNYMANGKGTRFYPFTTRIRCAVCGSSFRRCKGNAKSGESVHWRCRQGGKCEAVSIRKDDLERVIAEVMGMKAFDADAFRNEVEYIEAGKKACLTVHFKDGRAVDVSYTPSKKKMPPHTKEYREYMKKVMKEKWTPERRKQESEKMKRIRKERGKNWRKQ